MAKPEERAEKKGEDRRLPAQECADHPHEGDVAEAHRLAAEDEAGSFADELGQARADQEARARRPRNLGDG